MRDAAVPQAREGWTEYARNAWKRGEWRVWDEEWGAASVWVAWKMPTDGRSSSYFDTTKKFNTLEHAMIYAETMEAVGA